MVADGLKRKAGQVAQGGGVDGAGLYKQFTAYRIALFGAHLGAVGKAVAALANGFVLPAEKWALRNNLWNS